MLQRRSIDAEYLAMIAGALFMYTAKKEGDYTPTSNGQSITVHPREQYRLQG